MNSKRWMLTAGLGIWALALLGYLLASPSSGSVVSGWINDRQVLGRAASKGGTAEFVLDCAMATIQLGNQMAWIKAREIELSGGRIILIPPACKKIRLLETRNDIRVLFDKGESNSLFTNSSLMFLGLWMGLGLLAAIMLCFPRVHRHVRGVFARHHEESL